MYASVLNAQGRFLYDMFLFKQSGTTYALNLLPPYYRIKVDEPI